MSEFVNQVIRSDFVEKVKDKKLIFFQLIIFSVLCFLRKDFHSLVLIEYTERVLEWLCKSVKVM